MNEFTPIEDAENLAISTIRVLVADDHELFREGLRHVLQQLDGTVIVIEACDFPQALAAIAAPDAVDVVLLDLSMPGMAWTEGLVALRNTLSLAVPIIVLSASDDRRSVLEAIRLGAAGFIPKTSSSRVMISALKLVLSGGVYLPNALLQPQDSADSAAPTRNRNDLTQRQQEVLSLLQEGKSNKEIARVLELAEGTVKLHVTAILKALNVNNRTRAVVAANQACMAD